MCCHFAEAILEAANLCDMVSGVYFVMFRRYFLYTNLIYSILNFGKTAHAFLSFWVLINGKNVTNSRTTAKIAYLEMGNESLHIQQLII